MTAKYALQEGFVNLIYKKDDHGIITYGVTVSSFYKGKVEVDYNTGQLYFVENGKTELLALNQTVVETLGMKDVVMHELVKLVQDGKFNEDIPVE